MRIALTSLFFLFLFSCATSGQTIIINENMEVDSTKIDFKSDYGDFTAYTTLDNKKEDSLKVHIESIGLIGYVLNINFVEPMTVEFVIYSDANEFDGKHFMKVRLKNYLLVINKDKLTLGDKLMGTVSGKTEEFTVGNSTYEISFDGNFHHIIGRILRKRYEGDAYDSYDPRH